MVKRVAAGNDPGGAVGKGQRVNIGADEFNIRDAVARGFGARFFNHRRSQVRADRAANARGQRACVCAGTASEIDGQHLPGVCETGRYALGKFFAFLDSRAPNGARKNVRRLREAFANFFLVA